ncbi:MULTISPECIES: DUF3597 domain-containing protein [Rhizobium]|uniref:DUF3597 domain-containing protein n=1 Tax=Rhizobium rhododendri TaxID=2506430 RepID=A0ABY8IV73_9HYPH|nr:MULTISPECIES: DUF3597 domain-containing protein [Rhizobium]MBZ5759289.1 DUF3597 domain-containing protein [Rhizobium sp. VS19-DR96]MBZ5765978.1 DUF3597 domain-containing protein [Rhizobium sp. VS19-DR129.2]MBZ5774062.1 DUF3597 domain-containing protein [Rhizobium sp. VS19-DRK62.2]MBZ5785134.1 DUF3597 domain-containing protein [Rhizobium sp. VS19-DR121]MBZ5801789.1 DUF3597 domain-containing protein [Rhizobium sp. VS19-DR181]
MSIFDRIKNAIFGQAQAAGTTQASTASTTAAATPVSNPAPGAATPAPSAPSASIPAQSVDVAPILDAAVQKSGQRLDWKHSIVDLMKALGMDASLEERKELAAELHYQGDVHDSAKMNTFLHKALLQKLSENGGKVPPELLD